MTTRWLIIPLLLAGCATSKPEVKVHVPAEQAARVPATAPAVAAARQGVAAASAALAKAEAAANAATAAVRAQHLPAGDSPMLAAVAEAQRQRSDAIVAWRAGVVELMRWRLAAAQSHVELALARVLARNGADLDCARFRGEEARLQARASEAARQVTHLHATLDAREHALAAAKERYAATRRAPAQVTAQAEAPR